MLVLTALMDLKTRQVDYTAAFVQSEIDKPPNWSTMSKQERERSGVYIEMAKGFQETGKVLKLKKSLYGLRQSPRLFFLHLKNNLEALGFVKANEVDACLFISEKVLCLTYVDDCIFFAKDVKDVDDVIHKLRNESRSREIPRLEKFR